MKTLSSKNNSKKHILIISLAILVIVVASVVLFTYYNNKNHESNPTPGNDGIDYSAPSDEELEGEKTTEQAAPHENEGAHTSTTQIEITQAEQLDNLLRIRTIIQTISSEGTCKLSMTKEGSPSLAKEVDVQALSSYTTCKGFDIPVAELSTGEWKIEIQFNGKDLTGKVSQSVTIR